MGGTPYWYFVPYDPNHGRALELLRQREFEAGRYSEAVGDLDFDDPAFLFIAPGPRHASIAEAIEDSGDSGTQSILDIVNVGPTPNYSVAGPLDPEELEFALGTLKPTKQVIAARKSGILESLDRGECAYVVVYEGDVPAELFFAGYSYD
jgi:hypothetical protein